jgi:hypothetical protein
MDRRRCSPRRRSARIVAIAALSAFAVCASPHGGWLAPLPVSAHKPSPSPSPSPTPAPTPAPTPLPTPAPTPKPTASPGHHWTSPPAAAAMATPAPPPPSAPAESSAAVPSHAAAPTPHLTQRASVPTTLAGFASAARPRQLSGYVLGADILAAVAVVGSLALAELRRRRLV